MLIVPEVSTIFLFPPRTGSTSLKRALQAKYPNSISLYRHMEYAGIPDGYEVFRTIGILRHPLDRLWSLYKYLRELTDDHPGWRPGFAEDLRRSADKEFDDWLVTNDKPFSSGRSPNGKFFPYYHVRHEIPETKKSQRLWLGRVNEVHTFENIHNLALMFSLDIPHVNQSTQSAPPALGQEAEGHMRHYFRWDYEWHERLT